MRGYGIMGHELVGDLCCERGLEATTNIDCCQFLLLARIVRSEFRALTCKVGLFGVCLGVHRHLLTGSHRHSPGDQAGDPRDQHVAAGSMRRRNTQHQTCGRKDAVVRAQYRCAQSADMSRAMPFSMAYRHSQGLLALGRLDLLRRDHRLPCMGTH